MAEYTQAVMYPLSTPAGVKMPTLLGTDNRSSSIKSMASYPIYSDAEGRAAVFLTGQPFGVYLSPDNLGNNRGLVFSSDADGFGTAGYQVDPDTAQGYSQNPEELTGLYFASSAARIASFGANFQLSSAILNQAGNCAVRVDYARRFVPGGSASLSFPVFRAQDVINFNNAANGQEVTVLPATEGFETFAVPVSGAEDWHATYTAGYGNAVGCEPVVGYGLSSTDEEQTILLLLYSRLGLPQVPSGVMENILKQSYGAWSTTMICWVGLPPNTQVGTLNVALHQELIPKSKGVDYSQPKTLPQPTSYQGATFIASRSPKVRWGDAIKGAARAVWNFGKGMVKQINPELYETAASVANFLTGKAYRVNSMPMLGGRM